MFLILLAYFCNLEVSSSRDHFVVIFFHSIFLIGSKEIRDDNLAIGYMTCRDYIDNFHLYPEPYCKVLLRMDASICACYSWAYVNLQAHWTTGLMMKNPDAVYRNPHLLLNKLVSSNVLFELPFLSWYSALTKILMLFI